MTDADVVKLYCGVYEEATVFPVQIARDAEVSALQEKIASILSTGEHVIASRSLTLYLARKDGEWLTGGEDVEDMLRGEVDTSYQKMLPWWKLDEDYLGKNFRPGRKTIHVLVKLPPKQIQSYDGVFNHCNDQFFSQFATVDEVNSWLEFRSLLPLTQRQKLYVRSSYKVIGAQVLSNADPSMVKYAVITGTPGTGKSVFVYYIMWKLIKEKKRVLLIGKPPIYFDGVKVWDCNRLPQPGNWQFWSPDLWCLVDSVDPVSIAELPISRCSVLLASTPRRDCIGEFKKLVPTPDVFYMPLWTKEELMAITPLYPRAATVWEHRLNCLGGVPRLVLQDIKTDPQALLMSACSSCSLDDCIMLVSINSEINLKTKIIQTLIHINSHPPYQEYNVVYASELVVQLVARTKWRTDRTKLQNLLGASDGHPLIQALCGYIFEPYAMDLLEKGGTFVCRKLASGVEMRKLDTTKRKNGCMDYEDEQTIDIPQSLHRRQVVKRVEVGQVANQLYVPQASNYTAIDAWMPHFGGFQMTVGKKHEIKAGAASDLAKLGPDGNRLYFLLPPLYYKSFTKKAPQAIEQFGILIPYPEVV